MIDEGSSTARYRGTLDSAWEILHHIIQDANHRQAVLLQKEMVDMRKQLRETSAGQELYQTLDSLVTRQQDLLQKIRAETKREGDENILLVLETEYEIARKQLKDTISALQTLKLPLGKRLLHLRRLSVGFVRRNLENSGRGDLLEDSLTGSKGRTDLLKKEAIIALIGWTGTGKSEFIQMVTGNDISVNHGLGSGTTKISINKVPGHEKCDLDVVLLDTPGFDHTRTDKDVLESVTSWLNTTYGRGVTLDGMLYFHRISDNRWQGKPGVDRFEELCTSENVVLVTTMWDDVHPGHPLRADKEEREIELREDHWKVMLDKGSAIVRYERTPDSAWNVLRPFIQAANRRQTDLVLQEIADLRKHQRKPKAQDLYAQLQNLVQNWHDTRQKMRDRVGGQGNENAVLKAEYENYQKQLAVTMAEMRTLRLPLGTRLLTLFRSSTIT